jgi:hypothetical protein
VACMGSTKLVSGHFDGTIASIQIGGGGQDVQDRLVGLHSKLKKAARSLSKAAPEGSPAEFTRRE